MSGLVFAHINIGIQWMIGGLVQGLNESSNCDTGCTLCTYTAVYTGTLSRLNKNLLFLNSLGSVLVILKQSYFKVKYGRWQWSTKYSYLNKDSNSKLVVVELEHITQPLTQLVMWNSVNLSHCWSHGTVEPLTLLVTWYSGTSHTTGHMIQWNLSHCWSRGMVEPLTLLVTWYSGTSHCWSRGTVERHTAGHVVQWNVTLLVMWYSGTSHCSSRGTVEPLTLLLMWYSWTSHTGSHVVEWNLSHCWSPGTVEPHTAGHVVQWKLSHW